VLTASAAASAVKPPAPPAVAERSMRVSAGGSAAASATTSSALSSAPSSAPRTWTSSKAAAPPSAPPSGVARGAKRILLETQGAQRRRGGRERGERGAGVRAGEPAPMQVEVGRRAEGERERCKVAAVRRERGAERRATGELAAVNPCLEVERAPRCVRRGRAPRAGAVRARPPGPQEGPGRASADSRSALEHSACPKVAPTMCYLVWPPINGGIGPLPAHPAYAGRTGCPQTMAGLAALLAPAAVRPPAVSCLPPPHSPIHPSTALQANPSTVWVVVNNFMVPIVVTQTAPTRSTPRSRTRSRAAGMAYLYLDEPGRLGPVGGPDYLLKREAPCAPFFEWDGTRGELEAALRGGARVPTERVLELWRKHSAEAARVLTRARGPGYAVSVVGGNGVSDTDFFFLVVGF
jgi:hypothetical protein